MMKTKIQVLAGGFEIICDKNEVNMSEYEKPSSSKEVQNQSSNKTDIEMSELLSVLKNIESNISYLVKQERQKEADRINSVYKGGHGY